MALSETELINQYHNRHLLAFISVLNKLKLQETISSFEFTEDIKKIVKESSPYSDDLIDELIQNACENNIIVLEKANIRKIEDRNIFLPLTLHEKIYLKNILKSPYAVLFLDDAEIQNLLKLLADVPDMDFSKMITIAGTAKDPKFNKTYIKNFRLLVQAIKERRKISFSNIDAKGDKHINSKRIPVKIEYSVIMRCFWLSLWNPIEQRPFKANIARMSEIYLLEKISDEEDKNVKYMMEQKKERHPIVMLVTDENHAIERINLLFSMYHKKTERIEKDKIKISLNYYNFDENEIIDGILSFGPAVQVLSPESVVNKIKEKLTF